MFKEILLGLEIISSGVTPTTIKEIPIKNEINVIPIRKKRSLISPDAFVNGYPVNKPIITDSKVLMQKKERDNDAETYFIDNKSNFIPTSDTKNYNASLNWRFQETFHGHLLKSPKSVSGIYLFKKILGKKTKIEKLPPLFFEGHDLSKYTYVETKIVEHGFQDVKYTNPVNEYSIPIFDDSIYLGWFTKKDKGHYYYSNESILNDGSISFTKKEFKEKRGKKFLVKQIFFSPKLKVENPAKIETKIKLSKIYLNGNKINAYPIERNLYFLNSIKNFEKNQNDDKWKFALETAISENLISFYEINSKVTPKDAAMLSQLGFSITNLVIQSIPKLKTLSAIVSASVSTFEIFHTLLKDNNDRPITSVKESKYQNGDLLNTFSIKIDKPIAFEWNKPTELKIFDIFLEGSRKNGISTDDAVIKLDDFEVEFQGEWVDEKHYTLPYKAIDSNESGNLTGEETKIIKYTNKNPSIYDAALSNSILDSFDNQQEIDSYTEHILVLQREERKERERIERESKNNSSKNPWLNSNWLNGPSTK